LVIPFSQQQEEVSERKAADLSFSPLSLPGVPKHVLSLPDSVVE